jgi:RNA polymerase-binding protein DksA
MPRASKAPSRKAAKATKGAAKRTASKAASKASAKKAASKTTKAAKTTAAAKAGKAAGTTGRKKTTTAKTAKTASKSAAPAKAAARKRGSATLDKFLEGQRKALFEERETYLRQAETLKAEADALAEDMEPGDVQFDEESGEGDTINVERERDLALSAQARAAVEEIDKALEKIDAGTYGICEQCGEPIPKERLKALPYASLCVRCKSGGLGRR